MKVRSLKVSDEQWERWQEEAQALGMDRSGYIRLAVDMYSADGSAQKLVDEKNDEIARLKRELSSVRRGQDELPEPEKKRPALPGLASNRWACSECGKINVKGRCVDHPTARQRKL